MRLVLLLALLLPGLAHAADPPWPTRPVTLVVAYPPGAIVDTVGRRMAEQLGNALGSNVVVENRGGTGGNLAAAYVARATPDGHTLLFTSYGNLIIAAAANLQLGFHPWRDLAPVGMIGPMTVVLLVRPDFPAQTLQDFVRHVGAHPGTVNFASVGFGSSYHLLIEQMAAHGKLSMTHVPYRGGAAAMTDFLGGRVQATLATWLFARPYMADGSAKAIAVANGTRAPVAARPADGSGGGAGRQHHRRARHLRPGRHAGAGRRPAERDDPADHRHAHDAGLADRERRPATARPAGGLATEMHPVAESLGRLLREANIRLE